MKKYKKTPRKGEATAETEKKKKKKNGGHSKHGSRTGKAMSGPEPAAVTALILQGPIVLRSQHDVLHVSP